MIRAIATALCLIAVPATAEEMTADTCALGWQAFNVLSDQPSRLVDVEPDVTAKGWCRVDSSNAELKPQDFGSLEFRGVGIKDAVANDGAPQSLDVRIEGIDLIQGWKLPVDASMAGPRGSAQFSYTSDPETRAITLNTLEAEFGGFGRLLIKAKGGGIDLSSLQAMQITSGGGRVNQLTVQLQTLPILSKALFLNLPLPLAKILVRAVPDTSIDTASRKALLAFLDKGPEAGGLIRMEASSDKGMGFLQVVGGVMPLVDNGMSPENLSNSMEILFSDVTLSVEWVSID